MKSLLEQCARLADAPATTLQDLRAAIGGEADLRALDGLLQIDDSRPYGRRVLHDGPRTEVMIASWTPGMPCAPHDHGGSVGGVRVLRGQAVHRIWKVEEGALVLVLEERIGPGHILVCGPDLIHSMVDGGAEERLATLHVYTGPIPFMTVYDLEKNRTLRVSASCGAWIPGPELIERDVPGIVRRTALA